MAINHEDESSIEWRKAQAIKVLEDLLPRDEKGLRGSSGPQSVMEVLGYTVDPWGTREQRENGQNVDVPGDKYKKGVEKIRDLVNHAQLRLPRNGRLTDKQINRLAARLTEEQFGALVDSIVESDIPIMRKTSTEIRQEVIRRQSR